MLEVAARAAHDLVLAREEGVEARGDHLGGRADALVFVGVRHRCRVAGEMRSCERGASPAAYPGAPGAARGHRGRRYFCTLYFGPGGFFCWWFFCSCLQYSIAC